MSDIPACDLVIFGAKGDLTRRKLLPSLYQLEKYGKLPEQTKILGVGRADWDHAAYCEVAKDALTSFMPEPLDDSIWQRFSQRLNFHKLDVNDRAGFETLKNKLDSNNPAIFYFAMHPGAFGTICQGLAAAGLNQLQNRIVMEKPLGTDLKSSREINDSVAKFFNESQVYRIDHYLGKESVLNLLALRFANTVFASFWDRNSIDHVEITVAEQVGIEGRWGYFDKAGQMRDMVQNHLLQILTMIAMSPPANLEDDSLRNEKIAVLNALRPIDKTNIREKVVRGQYTAGFVNGVNVPGYLEEDGANQKSNTETFVAIRVDIDNWRWAGVPFYLRTGKRLPSKCSEVVVYFKPLPLNLFSESYPELPQNKLTIRLQPDEGMDIEILNKVPGLDSTHNLQTTKLDLSFSETFHQQSADAYERLLLEVMRGRQALFVHRDEVEAAWKWVDSIVRAWELDNEQPKTYQAGTWGPVASVALITKDGHSWHEF
ncbi:glucose-6-phosphate dehydrogenase [Gilliamella sp. Fer1-1]|jgi:glucose-6-phosphate 1-dehydrogenase|uniref:glucose-6-phosphate dehydrogenase n=1 Tax=unclassified Gilliamella TaxID=2685620 RepID=UPI00080E24E2|nr:glucose-6-phosphate dehydrogenase [Gilliamella apicola]OCG18113.1 glucose-6-phosphate dehydrogenase [Gilliamella apicola]OCG24929.1 glucose-6-phosphate dehydrogenase [Gilliamella apicola]OCG26663.1 glucose-6-phosphate dehydrogenase [Gilliamella apicola]OCG39574.1 glucose-6-phosphate dehydrogenase [Gilliamella apicola]